MAVESGRLVAESVFLLPLVLIFAALLLSAWLHDRQRQRADHFGQTTDWWLELSRASSSTVKSAAEVPEEGLSSMAEAAGSSPASRFPCEGRR